MTTARQIVDAVTRLPAGERRRVVLLLRRALAKAGSTRTRAKAPRRQGRAGGLAPLLALAGSGRSDHRDVSSDKYRHLGGCTDPR